MLKLSGSRDDTGIVSYSKRTGKWGLLLVLQFSASKSTEGKYKVYKTLCIEGVGLEYAENS